MLFSDLAASPVTVDHAIVDGAGVAVEQGSRGLADGGHCEMEKKKETKKNETRGLAQRTGSQRPAEQCNGPAKRDGQAVSEVAAEAFISDGSIIQNLQEAGHW
eukprot:SAG31_NODE_2163_length_6293_cov_2.483532_5_plen_103_part_00